MNQNKIIIGEDVDSPLYTFENEDIVSVNGQLATDLISDALSIDRLDPVVRQIFLVRRALKTADKLVFKTSGGEVFCPQFSEQNPEAIPYGTPVRYYINNNLYAKFYVDRLVRQARDLWKISAMSLMGIFDKQDHAGGVYTGQTFAQVIAEIFGGVVGTAFDGLVPITGGIEPCYVAEDLAAVKTYGWLPYSTKRANLHQLLFATGASLSRGLNYEIIFKFLDDLTAEEIEDGRIYMEGNTTGTQGVTGVEVTEHTYQWAYNVPPTELYNNTDPYAEPAARAKVIFPEPIRIDTATTTGNLEIIEIGPNYAILSGKGTLSAVSFIHLTRTITKTLDIPGLQNMKTVTGATLVSPLNSENVTARLFDFYTQAKSMSGAIVIKNEKPGNKYKLKNAFAEPASGIITGMSINATGILKGSFEAVTGFQLRHKGNNYNNSYFFDTATTWEVPQSIRNSDFPFIRLAMIGGGSGGQGGQGGRQGRGCYYDESTGTYIGSGSGAGGKGGAGGEAGQGGKVYAISKLDVTNIAKIKFTPGVGGAGGAAGTGGYNGTSAEYTAPGEGTSGSESTIELYNDADGLIATYSTAEGTILPYGVADVTQDLVFGLSGADGTAGADGGAGGVASPGADGTDGGNVGTWTGGKGSKAGYAAHNDGYGMMEAMAGGAGGGGAANGANGGDALSPGSAAYQQYVWGGDGGAGANAPNTPAASIVNGQGGDGGDGGGGGGSAGAQNWTPITSGVKDGTPGPGGNGTAGANGGGGCLFIYAA